MVFSRGDLNFCVHDRPSRRQKDTQTVSERQSKRERETDRQRERETGRQTERQTDRMFYSNLTKRFRR